MRLYEINADLHALLGAIAEAGGEITEEQEIALTTLELSLEQKAEHIALWVREKEAKAAAVKAEEDRLRQRRTALQNAADRAKQYLHDTMRVAGRDRIDAELATLTVSNNSRPTVTIADGAELPDWATRTTVSADKAALIDAAARGDTLPDGVSVTRGTHLRIR